ncbi:ABC transporter, ATP-binding protein [Leptospira ryugenii]|uniref:ABC transporter, ATP-binding protein n=1 Tax=Leptospira ryugenii TaxID=1917863 RepID=A0A2P2E0W2_9LEPT|nr:ABC transporter ATP-binding protein [Leptospira ryugenii]GBF50521.1 ABC transporter, ATP-binding protein [Leptospira ryugenii]
MVLELNQVSKSYQGFSKAWHRLLTGLTFGYFGLDTKLYALRKISFSVQKGEALGIIGRNGAGKSTLLKLIAKVTRPDQGKVSVLGTVRALLELGLGFNAELSGEENVYYNGLVWGYSPQQIKDHIDEIFSFAELSEYRNVPVKNYSSGMAMRLAFSLATAIRPDILIVDEALAVGDASFQQKCLKRFRAFLQEGSIVLFVSHDLALVSTFCSRVLILEKGELVFDGAPKVGMDRYMQLVAGEIETLEEANFIRASEFIQELDFGFYRDNGLKSQLLYVGETVSLKIQFSALTKMQNVTVGFHIDDERGNRIYGTNTFLLQLEPIALDANDKAVVRFHFPIYFSEGKYSLGFAIHQGESHLEGSYLWREVACDFAVERINLPKSVGISYIPTKADAKIIR